MKTLIIAAAIICSLTVACSADNQTETIAPAADGSETHIAPIPTASFAYHTVSASDPVPTITTPTGKTISLLPTEETKTELRAAINKYEAREAWCATIEYEGDREKAEQALECYFRLM